MDRWATFDCYGTLIDWNTGIREELRRVFGASIAERLGVEEDEVGDGREDAAVEELELDDEEPADDDEPHAGEEAGDEESREEEEEEEEVDLVELELDDLLQRYHAIERELENDGSLTYRQVMTEAMRRLGASEDDAGGLADSLPGWPPFPEVREALLELRARGWKLAILSNSDADLIEASKALIGVPFEETVVASEIRSYKPALMHWMEFYGRTLSNRRRHVHIAASSYHDIAPASRLRIPNVWVNRLNEPAHTAATREVRDMEGLPDLVDELMPA